MQERGTITNMDLKVYVESLRQQTVSRWQDAETTFPGIMSSS